MGFGVFSHFRILCVFEEFIEDNICHLGWETTSRSLGCQNGWGTTCRAIAVVYLYLFCLVIIQLGALHSAGLDSYLCFTAYCIPHTAYPISNLSMLYIHFIVCTFVCNTYFNSVYICIQIVQCIYLYLCIIYMVHKSTIPYGRWVIQILATKQSPLVSKGHCVKVDVAINQTPWFTKYKQNNSI